MRSPPYFLPRLRLTLKKKNNRKTTGASGTNGTNTAMTLPKSATMSSSKLKKDVETPAPEIFADGRKTAFEMATRPAIPAPTANSGTDPTSNPVHKAAGLWSYAGALPWGQFDPLTRRVGVSQHVKKQLRS